MCVRARARVCVCVCVCVCVYVCVSYLKLTDQIGMSKTTTKEKFKMTEVRIEPPDQALKS